MQLNCQALGKSQLTASDPECPELFLRSAETCSDTRFDALDNPEASFDYSENGTFIRVQKLSNSINHEKWHNNNSLFKLGL